MTGDQTLFMRADMVEQTWRIVQPVLDAWAEDRSAELSVYPAGSAGPSEADAALIRKGRRWRPINGDESGKPS
jgi:glucose-6-phosphate 1-dehydrogenase